MCQARVWENAGLRLMAPDAYEQHRPWLRDGILAEKARRRVELGPGLTVLFENAATVLYQVQEILRVEGIRDPAKAREELATYEELFLASEGVSCTLLLTPTRPGDRAELAALQEAAESAYLRLAGGVRVEGRALGPQVAVAGVHFRAFPTPAAPVGLGVLGVTPREALLPEACRRALAEDLLGPQSGTLLQLLTPSPYRASRVG